MILKKYCGALFPVFFVLLAGCRSSVLEDPSTIISYVTPQPGHVRLTVKNDYNTVVMTLVDEVQSGGTHTAMFDAHGLLSGVYYYTLEIKGVGNNYHYLSTKYLLMVK